MGWHGKYREGAMRDHKADLRREADDRAGIIRTKSGKVLTDEEINRLAEEAEQGYDPEKVGAKRRKK